MKAAREANCQGGRRDEHGQRYTVDFMVSYGERTARLRSAWNVRPAEDFRRLVSCYVLEGTLYHAAAKEGKLLYGRV